MSYNLVIVESPAKAKTIEKFLGEGYKVVSSFGHIRDLPKKNISIDVKNNFTPIYEITSEKKKLVSELRSSAKKAQKIYLASDDDREGEAISFHLKEALQLKDENLERIVFREITKKAILNAIQNPRKIDDNLVNSQQARRILDRIVGYYLSPVLWKKIKKGLSAGRVQSVAVRMIVEKERENLEFIPKISFDGNFKFFVDGNKVLTAVLLEKFFSLEDAKNFLEECIKSRFTIKKLEKKDSKRSPAAPFTTSSLQQEASSKLGFSVSQTMLFAQKLYESGKITYMRTDSVNISEEAIGQAQKAIDNFFGNEYFEKRIYKNKSANAQEAHEAIRPTDLSNASAGSSKDEKRLYDIIWRRTLASQMKDAKIEKNIATIEISESKRKLKSESSSIKFEGFLKAYNFTSENENDEESPEEVMLPPLNVNQELIFNYAIIREKFSKAPARYTEASLVKSLEEKGIGRPSTYAPTISTIQKRGYIIKEDRPGKKRNYISLILDEKKILTQQNNEETFGSEKQKLFPTDVAPIVNDFLVQNFSDIVNYDFTAKLEQELDEIAEGKISWIEMMKNFYDSFEPKVSRIENIEREKYSIEKFLGHDPKSNEPIYAKFGKYGAYVQLGEASENKKPKYASLRSHQRIETISIEEALELFKLPRNLGTFQENEVIINIGRFGPYIMHEKKFFSLPKDVDIFEVTLEEAMEIIEKKKEEKKPLKTFTEDREIEILNGRWGPYIKYKSKNFKIPKETSAEDLNYDQCLEIIKDNAKK